MKKYRTTKVWWDQEGYSFEIQDVVWDGTYFRINGLRKYNDYKDTFIFPQQLIENGADWIEEIKPERWRAQYGKTYYFISANVLDDLTIGSTVETEDLRDGQLYSIGNYLNKVKQLLIDEQSKLLE